MNLLLVHRYFWPDTPPYASMLRSIAESAVADGNAVTVFTAQPSYGGTQLHSPAPRQETIAGVHVERTPLLSERKEQTMRRGLNLLLFAAKTFVHILRNREADVVMAATTPPILVSLAAMLGSRIIGASYVYHMQDIYPEVLANDSPSLAYKLLRRLDAITTSRADRVVVLSEDMAQTVGSRPGKSPRVSIINNFLPDASHSAPGEKDETGPSQFSNDGSLQVVFAGNLGRFQGLEEVIRAFHILQKLGVPCHLVLLGSGIAEDDLRAAAGPLLDRTVFMPGRVSQHEAEQIVAASDLALVTLQRGLIRAAYPSKTMTYLSVGTPVLAAVERDSELATMLRDEKIGFSCDLTGDAIAAEIASFAQGDQPDRAVVARVAERFSSRDFRCGQWGELFEELADA